MNFIMMTTIWSNPEQKDWRKLEDTRNELTREIMLAAGKAMNLEKLMIVVDRLLG